MIQSMAPPFAADAGTAVRQVQVLHVQAEDLGAARRRLVQHPPQGPLADADVLAGKQLPDLAAGQRTAAVRPRTPTTQQARRILGGPPPDPSSKRPPT
jgi:hypothetical protein